MRGLSLRALLLAGPPAQQERFETFVEAVRDAVLGEGKTEPPITTGVPMRRPLYVTGTYSGPGSSERVSALCRLAVLHGFAPISQHPSNTMGVYGQSIDTVLDCGSQLAEWIARGGGHLWGVLSPDGNMPPDLVVEVAYFNCLPSGSSDNVRLSTWSEWRSAFVLRGILDEWERAGHSPVASHQLAARSG